MICNILCYILGGSWVAVLFSGEGRRIQSGAFPNQLFQPPAHQSSVRFAPCYEKVWTTAWILSCLGGLVWRLLSGIRGLFFLCICPSLPCLYATSSKDVKFPSPRTDK